MRFSVGDMFYITINGINTIITIKSINTSNNRCIVESNDFSSDIELDLYELASYRLESAGNIFPMMDEFNRVMRR